MSLDPLAPKVAERFYSALRRAFDVVKVKGANGETTEHEVLKRYGEFVVHAIVGGRGYSVVHAPTGETLRTDISARKVSDGLAKYLGQGEGKGLWRRVTAGDEGARTELGALVADFQPVPGPPKRGGGAWKGESAVVALEAAADGDHVHVTFRSVEAALRAAVEFRRDHPGNDPTDWLRVERRVAGSKAESLVSLRGAHGGWHILVSALSDVPRHLSQELLDEESEED